MSYRKFNAQQLFTGHQMMGSESVLITDRDGIVQDIVGVGDAGDGIEVYDGIICPGFVNCHCHLELSHLQNVIPREMGMTKFLLSVVSKRNVNVEMINEAMIVAESTMKESGIVAVGDISNTSHSLEVKRANNLYYHTFVEAIGFSDEKAEANFSQALHTYEEFARLNIGRVSIVPHSPYSVSDALFKLINGHGKGSIISIHNQESEAESEFFLSGSGQLLELYHALGIDFSHFVPSSQSSLVRSIIKITGDHSLILVHNVTTTATDLHELSRGRNLPDLFWCLCPNANIYIGNNLPDVELLKKDDRRIVIGTDSLASNSQLSILEEMKVLEREFAVSRHELLTWATINGAEALRISDIYGSFEKGKKPGVVHIGNASTSLQSATSRRLL